MRPGELLRQLDRQLLPLLVHRLARLGQSPGRLRLLTWTALVSSTAVLITAVWAVDHRPVEDLTVGEVTRVGVVQGQSIPGYLTASRDELAALLATPPTGSIPETYALVTFTDYLEPNRLPAVLEGLAVAEVFARVPLSGVQTQIARLPAMRLPGDVVAGMLDLAGRKESEARDYRARGAALAGEPDRSLRDWYDSGARVALAEAAAYRSGCACVYAAVVRATPAALAEATRRAEVRAVDPAPEVRRLDRAVFTPPLPEQHDVARPPVDAMVPGGAHAGASGLPTGVGPTSSTSTGASSEAEPAPTSTGGPPVGGPSTGGPDPELGESPPPVTEPGELTSPEATPTDPAGTSTGPTDISTDIAQTAS